jgi:predicted AAA+ superfamily ATPase
LKPRKKIRDFWGRLVESSIGAHLFNEAIGKKIEIFYWRDRNKEIDFVLRRYKKIVALEVKSGKRKMALPGMQEFKKLFDPTHILLVGGQGISIAEFLSTPIERWFEQVRV